MNVIQKIMQTCKDRICLIEQLEDCTCVASFLMPDAGEVVALFSCNKGGPWTLVKIVENVHWHYKTCAEAYKECMEILNKCLEEETAVKVATPAFSLMRVTDRSRN